MATAAEKLASYRRSQSGLGDISFIKGADGKDGKDGVSIKGDKGDTGPVGPQGEQGIQGEKGDRGVQGPRGSDGKDGKNGKDGKDGKDGQNSITPDVSAVVDLVLKKIADGDTIKPEHVKGLPKTLNELITHLRLGGFRGGGGSTSSGSGFTTIAATETPNGTLKVFSFGTHTTQPSFLLVDGAFMPATTNQANWTWASNAATFINNAPQDSVYYVA